MGVAILMKGFIQMVVLPLVAVGVFLLVGAAPAAAAKPCWQVVIDDWADNSRVDGRYEIHCYRDALRRLPEDMRAYSSAPDDIARAMRDEIRRQQQEAAAPDDQQAAPAPTDTGGSGKPPKAQEDEALPYMGPVVGDEAQATDDGIFTQALDEIGPSNSSSFPLPLLILGGITGLLLLAGGLGYIVKRGAPQRSRPRSPSTR
jgi:hypothetical protein